MPMIGKPVNWLRLSEQNDSFLLCLLKRLRECGEPCDGECIRLCRYRIYPVYRQEAIWAF